MGAEEGQFVNPLPHGTKREPEISGSLLVVHLRLFVGCKSFHLEYGILSGFINTK